MRTPIAGVRLRQRILLSTVLRRPALRRDDRSGLERVLSSCGDFDPADPPSRHRFRALRFQHHLFTGRGEALLEWLGYPMTSAGYEQFLLRACPEAAATRMLAERGPGEYSVIDEPCSSDVQALTSERFADPSSVIWPTGRHADVGLGSWGVAATTPPFDRLLAQENATLLRERLFDLTPRRITILERRYGLHGEERRTLEQIAGEEAVTRERIRGIEACALRRLRLSMGQRLLSDRSLDEERPIAPRGDRAPLVYRLPEPRPSRRDRSWMSTVYAALAEASAACSTSELAGCLRAPRVDVARGLRGLVRAGRVTATDDGYLAVGSPSP
jgi:hypothetical protein